LRGGRVPARVKLANRLRRAMILSSSISFRDAIFPSCPAKAGKGDRALARWKGRGPLRDLFHRQHSVESDAPSTMLCMVPLPRYRGGGRVLAFSRRMCTRVLQIPPRLKCEEESGRRNKEVVVPAFSLFATPASPRQVRKGSGTPTDACSHLPCSWHGRAPDRDALACRRSTAVLTYGLSPVARDFRPGFLGRDENADL
jgi:hypothetical protein